jgi:DUF4097 and DUF4098 domain-containing protein YvlB
VPSRLSSILLACIIAVPAFAHAEEWNKTYSVSGKPEIRVDANDADIRVYASDTKDIEALLTTRGYKIGSGGVSISERQTGNRIEISVHVPNNFHIFSLGGIHKSVQLEMKIPQAADLDLHSGDGKIIAENLNGAVTLSSGDGDIRVNRGKGSLNIETGDGRVECRSIEGDLRAETKDGSVRIDGVFTRLDLHTGDGSIDADARAGSKMAAAWTVRTGDGSVNLALPDGFSADVDVHTGDGHINVDFPVTVEGSLRENAIRGKINGGGQVLEVKTGDGSITLTHS